MDAEDKLRMFSGLRRPEAGGLTDLGHRLQRDLDEGSQAVGELTARLGITEQVDLTRVAMLVAEDPGEARRRYRVVSPLAKGGMGAIFKAVEVTSLRQVALKVLLAGESAKPLQVKRFLHEAQITAQLEHPNIVPVHEVGADGGGNLYYAMKYVRGVPLDEIVRGLKTGDPRHLRAYPLTRLLTIFQKACDAVAFAHAHGVVHRDLKPANIMVGEFGEVLVLDWGVAKLTRAARRWSTGQATAPEADSSIAQAAPPVPAADADDGSEEVLDVPSLAATFEMPVTASSQDPLMTLAGEVVGTPNYMAPEQAQGQMDLDARADIYSLGAILYTLLTTQPPIVATSMPELMLKKSTGEVHSPLVYHRSPARLHRLGLAPVSLAHCPHGRIPRSLAAVAMKALALAPSDRYSDVQSLQRDLDAFQGGFATAAEDAGLIRQLRLLVSRHQREAAILATAVLVLTAMVATLVIWQGQAKALAEQTLQQLQAEQSERLRVSRQAAGEYLTQAWSAYHRREWGEAAALCELARQLDGDRADAKLLAVLLQLGSGRPAIAIELARRTPAPDDDELRILWTRVTNLVPALSRFVESAQPERGALSGSLLLEYADTLLSHGLSDAYEHSVDLARKLDERQEVPGEGSLQTALAAARKLLERRNGDTVKLRFLSTISNGVISLDLSRNERLVGLEVLAGLPIAELNLSYSGVADLVGVEKLPRLRRLDAKYTALRDLEPLRNCRELEWLDLTKTAVVDLRPLAGLPLRQLWLTSTEVSDMSPVAAAPLERLELAFCRQVRDLAVLKDSRVQVLNVEGTSVRSLEGVRGVPLQELTIAGTSVHDLEPLRGAPLRRLVATRSQVADLSPLAGMHLTALAVGHTAVAEVTALRGMPLTRLELQGCENLRSVAPLAECPELRELLLPVSCRELAPLRQLPGLIRIGYGGELEAAETFWRRLDGAR